MLDKHVYVTNTIGLSNILMLLHTRYMTTLKSAVDLRCQSVSPSPQNIYVASRIFLITMTMQLLKRYLI